MVDINTRIANLLKEAEAIKVEFEPSVVSTAEISSELRKRATEQNNINARQRAPMQYEM